MVLLVLRAGRRSGAVVGGLIAAALLSACATSAPPAPEIADVPMPEAFARSGEAPLPEQWWRHFEDPRLDSVVEEALGGSFSLAAARARLRAARAMAEGQGAAQLPRLDASVGGQSVRDGGDSQESYSAGATASYEVDLWGRIESRSEASRLDAEATAADLRAAAVTLTADTATAYYTFRRQQMAVSLLQDQLETSRRVASLVETQYRNGQAHRDAVLRQREAISGIQAQLESARGELERLHNTLAALLGKPPQALELPPAESAGAALAEVPPLPETGVPAEWLQRRPDLQAAWLRVRSADAQMAAAITERYPRIDLSLSSQGTAQRPGAVFDNWLTTLAANLSVPLFRGGELAAQADRARAQRAVAFNEYAQTALDALAEVETALAAEHYGRRRLERLEARLRDAERASELLRSRYRNGAVPYLDVLTAVSSLQQAERDLLNARWALILDRVTLSRTLAGAWDGPAVRASEPSADEYRQRSRGAS
ncbi:MAG: TolC family protein [Halofilum sp. (in: g-proteobacteria)]